MKTFEEYRQILSKHQNIQMLSVMQVDNICRAMYDLENSQPLPSISDGEIDKESAKRWEECNKVFGVHGEVNVFAFKKGFKSCYKWLRDRLTTQKDNNGWVSVETKPEIGIDPDYPYASEMLLLSDGEFVYYGQFENSPDNGESYLDSNGDDVSDDGVDIIYWQPLPPPPNT